MPFATSLEQEIRDWNSTANGYRFEISDGRLFMWADVAVSSDLNDIGGDRQRNFEDLRQRFIVRLKSLTESLS